MICQNSQCPPARCSQLARHQLIHDQVTEPPQLTLSQAKHLILIHTKEHLELKIEEGKPFFIDFLSGKLAFRASQAGLRKEWLARALGTKPSEKLSIVDATAGLGRDSFILAKLGFEVTLIERSCVLYMLLADGMERAREDARTKAVIGRMSLVHADAKEWLNSGQNVDIVYMDPMFPEREKSASVKKEMRIIQDLLGKEDKDADVLLSLALTCARKRVVVKRPRHGPHLGNHIPSYALSGKSSRFDVYLIENQQKVKK